MTLQQLVDGHGRRISDLRVSVTDRCNFRCQYCMPADGLPWLDGQMIPRIFGPYEPLRGKPYTIDEYKADAERNSKDFEKKMDQYQKDLMAGESPTKPTPPKLGPAPEIAEATRIPDDLSGYVDFLHPWGGHFTNLAVLLTMLFVLLGATGISLRAQDI